MRTLFLLVLGSILLSACGGMLKSGKTTAEIRAVKPWFSYPEPVSFIITIRNGSGRTIEVPDCIRFEDEPDELRHNASGRLREVLGVPRTRVSRLMRPGDSLLLLKEFDDHDAAGGCMIRPLLAPGDYTTTVDLQCVDSADHRPVRLSVSCTYAVIDKRIDHAFQRFLDQTCACQNAAQWRDKRLRAYSELEAIADSMLSRTSDPAVIEVLAENLLAYRPLLATRQIDEALFRALLARADTPSTRALLLALFALFPREKQSTLLGEAERTDVDPVTRARLRARVMR